MTALVDIPADQIVGYSPETIIEWLLAHSEQRRARLLTACETIRAASIDNARAIESIRTALVAAAAGDSR